MKVKINPIALNLLRNLDETDKKKVEAYLRHLESIQNEDNINMKKIITTKNMYIGRINNSTRVSLKVDNSVVEVLDVFNIKAEPVKYAQVRGVGRTRKNSNKIVARKGAKINEKND